ncbi:DNA helicase [Aspergillus candidus]|uniref:ATP-dependent DNA helicase CHL1 n=1 Tax=Aspergillus candidus TaxID=41067 RepID=A0A2I2FFF2_ASPCN|nr:ATP-dependent RNA helicase CHL1 [Aspergillus candidus]PLB39372.1 ATP-dependent RNA helicase CHL1 [Aspergillus candidus]
MELQGEDFHHPYTPYDIQLEFMRSLYSCLEDDKVAIFESPTGTGKSLSLICGALTWLRDHKRRTYQENLSNTKCKLFRYPVCERQVFPKLRSISKTGREQKTAAQSTGSDDRSSDDEFALDDYDSEGEERSTTGKGSESDPFSGLSSSTLELLERFKGKYPTVSNDEEEEDGVRIFYCSRTHSQLTQFANELRRVSMPSSLPEELSTNTTTGEAIEERIKHLSLGSRKNLCINPRVQALENPTAINERCMELQKPGAASQHKCTFLPSKETESQVVHFRDHALATVKDIEDLGKLGKKIGICPYYASRSVINHSEIITLPYPLLLQRSAREALKLSVKGHVVIIDEAHNLMDAISSIHSVTVTLSQLQRSIYQLTTYAKKFKTRLKGKNRSYIAQVIRLINSIADHLRSILGSKQPPEGSVRVSDLMAGKGADQINPYKLSRYLQESKLARKVDGYVEHTEKQAATQAMSKPTTPVLFHIQSFLLPLMNPTEEGRLFYNKNQGDIQLTYMLLDPTNHFREIVEDAKAVILAGGTMSPMTDYMHHLFSYVPSDRLGTFSYGHVIPSENLIVHSLAKGVLGTQLDFTYEARNSEKLIMDLGRTIASLCQAIPDGVVAFFPSYDYLSRVLSVWKKATPGQSKTVYDAIERQKPILYEGREMAVSTEELLQEYATAIDTGRGALLLSVVGGKLSEGINFSDKLGRGVLIIGLPFPNIRSAVWQAKIKHVERKAYKQSLGSEATRQSTAKSAGREFYENSCMRAVNQCIGRAIRHRNDYASIVLIDQRYEKPSIQSKLPAWIQQSIRPAGNTVGNISRFFGSRAINS